MGLKKGQHHKGQFKAGKSGNPGGKKPLPEDIKIIANSTKPAIITAYHKLSNMRVSEADKYEPANLLESGIKTCLQDFSKTGKTDQVRHIWAECHGKPKETSEITVPEGIQIVFSNKTKQQD